MHYMNKREAHIGDWVAGPTHNSQGKIRVGIVRELMPEHGPCNVKLHIWPSEYNPGDDNGFKGEIIQSWDSRGREDYADAKELIHVLDSFRMASAVEKYGDWNAPYFEPHMGMHKP